ncbi:MAG: VPS10 domain-containing protein [Acidobacteriota bacterium]
MKLFTLVTLLLTFFISWCASGQGISAALETPTAVWTPALAEQAEWNVTGPFGGTVRALAQDPTNPKRMFIGTADGQIYTTADSAQTWRWLPTFNRPRYIIESIIIDPTATDTLYAAVWVLEDNRAGGVYKSTDGGQSWRVVLEGESVRAFAMAPGNASVLVAGTLSGVFRSTDGGENWSRLSPAGHPGLRNIESVAVDPRSADTIYVGTWYLPWKTTDAGKTWTFIHGETSKLIEDSDIFSIAIDTFDPDRVYCSACSGIYHSLDGGRNWTKFKGIPSSARRTHVIFPHPTREKDIFAGTTEGLWHTTDGGETWQQVLPKTTTINEIRVHPSAPERVIVGTENRGVLISEDGGATFQPFNHGFVARRVSGILADGQRRGRLFASVMFNGAEGGVYISNDFGQTWSPASQGLGAREVYGLHAWAGDTRRLYAATSDGVFVSDNGGQSWQPANPPAKWRPTPVAPGGRRPVAAPTNASPAKGRRKAARPTARRTILRQRLKGHVVELVSAADGWLYAAAWEGLFRTDNPSKGWEKINLGGYRGRVFSVAVSPRQPDVILAGISDGMLISRDSGMTWQRADLPMKASKDATCVQEIAFHPQQPESILVGTRRTAYVSFDEGKSWERLGRGVPYGDIAVIRFNPQQPNEIVIGDAQVGGLYLSVNNGQRFYRIDEQAVLPGHRVWAAAFDVFTPGRIYAGSVTSGVVVVNLPALASKTAGR